MLRQLMLNMGGHNDYVSFFTDDIRRNVLRSIVDGYYQDIHPIKTPLDTNGFWAANMRLISELFPDAKIICMARDLAWVMDSVETLVQKNPMQISKMFHHTENTTTVYTRIDAMLNQHGFVGYGWFSTFAGFYSDLSHKMIMIDYETLCLYPEETLNQFYDSLGMPRFKHQFNDIKWVGCKDFDERNGTPGLHNVFPQIRKWKPRRTVLPPEVFQRYVGQTYWRKPYRGDAKIICAPEFMVRPEASDSSFRPADSIVHLGKAG
jgi:sulfotransferase